MSTFLTVKEAAQRTGKSASSIRRILYKVLADENHPDRVHFEPTPGAVTALRMKGETFAWKVSDELLRRDLPEGGAKATTEPKTARGDDSSAVIIDMLRNELVIKNAQIATQNDLLIGLSERLREGNLMMGSLQKQLSFPDGSGRNKSAIVEAKQSSTPPPQGSEPSTKTHWLFRTLF